MADYELMEQVVKDIVLALCREVGRMPNDHDREEIIVTLNGQSERDVRASVQIVGPIDPLRGTICGFRYFCMSRQKERFRLWKLLKN